METRRGQRQEEDTLHSASIEREAIDAEALGTESLGPEPLTDEERLLILFAYLGPLAFVSLLASSRGFVRWHARQGILFATFVFMTFVLLRLPHTLLFKISPFLGQIFMTVEILIGAGFFLVGALSVIRGLEGTRFRIPFLGNVVDRF